MQIIVVIPARGGSKGVPRKNLRPLAGRPLIAYAIEAALGAGVPGRVIVSTDSEEIALFAQRFGADVARRPAELAEDHVTLDPVIVQAVEDAERRTGETYDVVLTVQPTSPLVSAGDIAAVAGMFGESGPDTVISAVDDRHLRWRERDGRLVPDYGERLNRQQLPPSYRETGAILACRREVLASGSRIGDDVRIFLLPPERSIDIDTPVDFQICEALLRRRRIVFNVAGHERIGLGHAYRGVTLAHELLAHELHFVCGEDDDLAAELIAAHHYPLVRCRPGERLRTLLELAPDLVINDVLDTSADFVLALQRAGARVINFEDMGLGAEVADLVVNALYPHQMPSEHILVGPRYCCLRDEFLHLPPQRPVAEVERLLLTFGGVDEGDLTCRVLGLLAPLLAERGIAVDVVVGPGYAHSARLSELLGRMDSRQVEFVGATCRISEYMARADVAVTSGGRTVLELSAVGVPTVVICQNAREATHSFASSANGIINLGVRHDLEDSTIAEVIARVIADRELRQRMRARMSRLDLTRSKARVVEAITGVLPAERGAAR